MTGIEEALAHAAQLLFARVLMSWWRSLDTGTKGEIEIALAIVLMIALFVFILRKLPEHSDRFPTEELNPLPAKKVVSSFQPSKPNVIQSHWVSVGIELRVGALLSILLLLLAALGSWPYNFYIFMRIVVCISFALFAVVLHGRRMHRWEAALGFSALLFNPLAPFHFARDTWQWLNVAAAITMALGAIFYARVLVATAKNAESPLTEPDTLADKPTNPIFQPKPATYRYCTSCSIRVGRKAIFCKRCGAALT